ncbi:RNA polymerase sigma factor SigJ [Neobacillus sp. PS3-40]|uniref:RNA polymerase sigma factor SigJ n=1 Tax=Neobacillus sp. PS3-40 TaxID=3070679 RepID=UPI0027DF4801|nr:RNA polymerase sigma factor SigJ [Neobacillus sp. PS3-40]WML42730.1 RNA polymerase sigma factor SigJ [Neobacillus sp. PS3-40]
MQEMYEKYKRLLFKLAYQLTGSVSDAEDAVQDVFLKLYDVPPEKLGEPKAYLCKMVTNRCRDLQKTARKKREQYFGEWLPEPLFNTDDDSMESSVVRDDLLSYGMLVLLEKLTPSERVVFVLREALSFEYHEIAKLIEKSEVNCRKLLSRASAKLGISSDEEVHSDEATQEMVHDFIVALKHGNLDQIVSMLDQNVVLVSDGGGKVSAVVDPIETRNNVAEFLFGPVRQASMVEGISQIEISQINGQPALILRSNEGIHTVGMLHIENNLIRNIYLIRNPDKLKHVGV